MTIYERSQRTVVFTYTVARVPAASENEGWVVTSLYMSSVDCFTV